MAYDFEKWIANDMAARRRKVWVPWAVIVAMLIALVMPVAGMIAPDPDDGLFVNLLPVMLPMMLALANSPFARDTILTTRGRDSYDEFERDAIGRATARAYSVLLGLGLAGFAWMWLATVNGWPMPRTPHDWSAWGAALLVIGIGLPVAFAEFLVPIPPKEELLEE